jgi:diguanylate cyclase (GGDEF)-like protein
VDAAEAVATEVAEPAQELLGVLGSEGGVGVLLISPDDMSDFLVTATSQNLRRRLGELGQVVAVTTPGNWVPAMAGASVPEVVVVDPGSDVHAARELCREVGARCDAAGATLVVALPLSVASHLLPAEAMSWEFWRSVGVDSLLDANLAPAEVRAHFELWARHARLMRAHGNLSQALNRQVQTDELTQVFNRRYFFQAAHREVNRARRYNHALSCLMVDVNYFSVFNKTFGYACGDEILRAIAHILRSWTRESDIVARFGAKKFVILLPETDVEGAMLLHEKLLREVEEHGFMWHGTPLPVSISIGEAERRREPWDVERYRVSPEPLFERRPENEADGRWADSSDSDEAPPSIREELADLLEGADAALYVAKKGVRYPNITPPIDRANEVIGILGRD